jgi:hypothetical protein
VLMNFPNSEVCLIGEWSIRRSFCTIMNSGDAGHCNWSCYANFQTFRNVLFCNIANEYATDYKHKKLRKAVQNIHFRKLYSGIPPAKTVNNIRVPHGIFIRSKKIYFEIPITATLARNPLPHWSRISYIL